MRTLFSLILVCVLHGLSNTTLASVTMVWSSEVGLQAYKSDGSAALDSAFVAELGIFQPGFVPSAANLGDWNSQWQPFGSVPYDSVDQQFNGQTTMTSNAAAPAGSQIYLWLRKDTPAPSEWFIATNDSADGNALDNWIMPDLGGTDQTDRPLYFTLEASTAPDLTVPFGKTPGETGTGDFTAAPGAAFAIQTHSIVVTIPEPSASMLALLAGSTVILRRRRVC